MDGWIVENKYIPITYKPKKADKEKFDRKKLPKVAGYGFKTQIGYITNIETALVELQSKFEKYSAEWLEIENRLKLCRKAQGMEIDRAKNGVKLQAFPKYWTKRQVITEKMYEELFDNQIQKIEKEYEFNNKLVIDGAKPYFMRYVYPQKNKEYKSFLADFTRLSRIYWGCDIENVSRETKDTELYKEFIEYYNRKNPLLETNGVMNKICRYMEQQVKEFKISQRYKSDEKMFDLLYNKNLEIENFDLQLEKMQEKYEKYLGFKKNKMLGDSQYSTYEQYFKAIKNECLEEISSNGKELANLAIYICYKKFSSKPKDFAWDCFGEYILANILENKDSVWLPLKNEYGNIEYLGSKYNNERLSLKNGEVDVEKSLDIDFENLDFDFNFEDFDLEENIFDFEMEE